MNEFKAEDSKEAMRYLINASVGLPKDMPELADLLVTYSNLCNQKIKYQLGGMQNLEEALQDLEDQLPDELTEMEGTPIFQYLAVQEGAKITPFLNHSTINNAEYLGQLTLAVNFLAIQRQAFEEIIQNDMIKQFRGIEDNRANPAT